MEPSNSTPSQRFQSSHTQSLPTRPLPTQAWHTLDISQSLDALSSTQNGLSTAEAESRLSEYGPNELKETGGRSRLSILLDQFSDIMLLMLIGVAIVAAILDIRAGAFPKDAIAISAIVLLNAILGYLQESRAEQALAGLKSLSAPNVRTLREGQSKQLPAKQLVPGDVVLLEAGDQVAADGRLLEAASLQARESALTGEATAVEKRAPVTLDEDTPLADRSNLIFQGTEITKGRGKMLVTRTGMDTELGQIATLIQSVGDLSTPLQQRLKQLGNVLVIGSLSLVALVVAVGTYVLGFSAFEELLTVSLSMAVAVVPEGLPAVITVTLAIGTQRMVKRQALIRRLPAVETLGSVTTICSDKTGTLTQNKMVVQSVHTADLPFGGDVEVSGEGYSPEGTFRVSAIRAGATEGRSKEEGKTLSPLEKPTLALLLLNCALCNDAALQKESGEWAIIGDPTEGALVTLAAKAGLDKGQLDYEFERIGEIPFSSERKRMSVAVSVPEGNRLGISAQAVLFTKGSAELLLETCDRIDQGGRSLTPEDRTRILQKTEALAELGQRVLGFAYKPLDFGSALKEKSKALQSTGGAVQSTGDTASETEIQEDLECDLIWLGMVAMIDAPRPEVRDAVRRCQKAGIRPVMITGDHPLTARAIAYELGLVNDSQAPVHTGAQIEAMSAAELTSAVQSVSVYARVSPEHKLRIVKALQAQNQVVAMTGDGVNDAPALKQADIGVAMGITGTDVSKDASDMVLLNDNFASIVAAAEEGRVVYSNIRRFVKYILGSNIGEVITIALSPLLLPIVAVPLTPLQILWMNLVTDGFPALALAMEPPEQNIMDRAPHSPKESIFARGLGWYMVRIGLVFAVLAITLMLWAYGYTHSELGSESGAVSGDPDRWKTMVFTMLCLSQMGHAIAVRSSDRLAIETSQFSNPYVLLAVCTTTLLQLLLIYLPPLRNFFGTHALSLTELMVCVGFSALLFVWIELEKLFIRKRLKNR